MKDNNIQITHIPLTDIEPSPLNPRKHFDDISIAELAQSIAAEGVLQPILVRPYKIEPDAPYEIVAGERRYRASLLVPGMETIPCIIRTLTNDEALEIMITENLQRKEIHPMEEAAAFQQLLRVKDMDVKELAARVGKSPSFVAQRLRLCDLIEPIQQHFFNGLLLVKDALRLSQLRPDDQQDFYNLNLDGDTDVYDLSEYEIEKYQRRLDRATFSIHDEDLIKGKPACTQCPYNSASALLFQDPSQEAICHDASCYRDKCDRAFEISIETAEAQQIVQITGQRYSGHKIDKETQKLLPTLTNVLPFGSYTEVEIPEQPEREDYFGYTTTEDGDQAYYERDLDQWYIDLADFNKKVNAGKYTRALIIGGDRKGQYTYIQTIKESEIEQSTQEEPKDASAMTAEELTAEVKRLQARFVSEANRDDQARWQELKELADPSAYVSAAQNQKLSVNELQAIAAAIYDVIDSDLESTFRSLFYGSETGSRIPDGYLKGPHLLADMLRFFFVATLPPYYMGGEKEHNNAALMEACLAERFEKAVDDIGMRHKQIADAKADDISRQIKALDAQLADLNAPKPKKGKGIKALIPAILLMFLFGCSPDDAIPVPVCTMVTTKQDGDRLSIEIHSASLSIEMCREWGRCYTIPAHYYGCVSTSVESDEVITFVDGTEECQVITDHQLN